MSVTGLFLEDLYVGQTSARTQRLDLAAVTAFADLTGDRNPVHLDQEYAEGTRFKGRIAHGMLTASLVSAVLGMDLPGPGAIYLAQSLAFKRPVRLDDEVTARATVTSIDLESGRVRLATHCLVGGKVVVEGEAEVIAPRRPLGDA
jgi:3-hydroxybutyryl-CoA dehydratase